MIKLPHFWHVPNCSAQYLSSTKLLTVQGTLAHLSTLYVKGFVSDNLSTLSYLYSFITGSGKQFGSGQCIAAASSVQSVQAATLISTSVPPGTIGRTVVVSAVRVCQIAAVYITEEAQSTLRITRSIESISPMAALRYSPAYSALDGKLPRTYTGLRPVQPIVPVATS